MEPKLIDEKTLREYLLGRLDESECAEIDQKILEDDTFAKTIEVVEDEIVEDYLDGALAGPDKQAAEKHFFQSPEHQHKLNFARLLRCHLGKKVVPDHPSLIRPPIPTAFYWAASVSMVVLLSLTTGLGVYTVKLRRQVASEEAKNSKLQDDLAREQTQIAQLQQAQQAQIQHEIKPNSSQEFSIVISPVPINRELGAVAQTKYRPGTKWLEVHISLIDFPAETYSAVLKTASGKQVWSDANLKPKIPGKLLVFKVPYERLSPGRYSLLINDREYSFRIG
jgi:hypothetical protein